MANPPVVKREITSGITSYKWRYCPYSTSDGTNRIPTAEKTIHYTTSGCMTIDARGGHDNMGFVCLDPNCSFYLGTATTKITMTVRVQRVDTVNNNYYIETVQIPIPICSGHHFWEK